MEDISIKNCAVCSEIMNDPRILPCYHSFCLKCLESLTVSTELKTRCPTCQIEFQIPAGGLKYLKKNEFIGQLTNLKQNMVVCNSCKEDEAVKFCIECSFNYCSNCLLFHGRNPASINHQLQSIKLATNAGDQNKYSTCNEHWEIKTLFCKECKLDLCARCFTQKHNTHSTQHMKDYFDSVTKMLQETLKRKEEIMNNVNYNYKISEEQMNKIKLKVSNLKKEIQQRGEDLKKDIDSIVAEFTSKVEQIFQNNNEEADAVLLKLKYMERNVKVQMECLQKQLKDLNYENVVKTSSNIVKTSEVIPYYEERFNILLSVDVREQTKLAQIFGSLNKAQNLILVEKVKLNTEQNIISFAPMQSRMLVSSSKDIFWSNNEGIISKTFYDFKNNFQILDLLLVNNFLYVAGDTIKNFTDMTQYIYKFDMEVSGSSIIYECKDDMNILLSKSQLSTLLLITKNKIRHLSENGKLTKTINLQLVIFNALQLQKNLYVVCCYSELWLVNDFGEKIIRYSPDLDVQNISFTSRLEKDKFGNIYVSTDKNDQRKIFVLDRALKIISSHDVDSYVHKMYYDESKDLLLVLQDKCELLTFKL